jgi:hypothetical protein
MNSHPQNQPSQVNRRKHNSACARHLLLNSEFEGKKNAPVSATRPAQTPSTTQRKIKPTMRLGCIIHFLDYAKITI